jgi:hypothetical protein
MKLSISVLVFSLSVVSLIGLNGCNRQDPPPKVGKELPQVPDTAVGGMARGAIDKAKGVETTLGEVGNRTAETSKEGLPYARDLEFMTWRMSSSLHATIQLVRLRNYICE